MSETVPMSEGRPVVPAPVSQGWRPVDVALLIGALLVALCVRAVSLDPMPSFDELWHLGLSTGNGSPVGWFKPDVVYSDPPRQTSLDDAASFLHVWANMDGVLHPPLYVLTLRLWRDAFGSGDAVAQAYSVFWSLVTIAFCFIAVRLATDRWMASLVALAMAAAPTQVYFAQEIRGYAMLTGVGAIALWQMTRTEILGVTRRRAVVLALLTLPIVLTHYFGAGAALAIGLYGLSRMRGHRVAFVVTLSAAAVAYAVAWVPFALRQLDDLYTGDDFLHVPRVEVLPEAGWLLSTPIRLAIDTQRTWSVPVLVLVAMLGTLVFVLPWFRVRRLPSLMPWTMYLVGSVLLIALLDIARSTRHAMFVRYLAVATPAAFALLAGIGWTFGRSWGYLSAGILVALTLLVPRLTPIVVATDSPGFYGFTRWLEQNLKPDDGLIVFNGDGPPNYADMLLLSCGHSPNIFPRPVVKVTKPLSRELISKLPRRVWLIVAFPDGEQLGQMFPGIHLLQTHGVAGECQMFYVELPGSAATQPAVPPA